MAQYPKAEMALERLPAAIILLSRLEAAPTNNDPVLIRSLEARYLCYASSFVTAAYRQYAPLLRICKP
jgi:hypothetical protein